jgi:FtsP/CotA-like multicopper oxidase with cupredoxin domain
MRQNTRALRRLLFIVGVVLALSLAPAAHARTVHYWIAAVPESWNVVPSGRDPISGRTFTPEETTMQTVLYRKFTRGWGRRLPDRFYSGDNDGIPGPTIRARVGDTVLVHFKNLDTAFGRPHSMHFHGFFYEFSSDGSFIPDESGQGAAVPPGGSVTYRLRAAASSAGVWPYHDHGPAMRDSIGGGMYGAISIRGARERRPDRENVVFFGFHQGLHTVNGRAFIGNTPTFRARVGELVQWDVLAIGDEFHTFHLHGHRWRFAGEFIDNRSLGPADAFRVRIREDVRGAWLYHCHVEFHQENGMIGLYRVGRRAAGRAGASGGAGVAGKP